MKTLDVKRYEVLEVHGNAYERGFSYGKHHADRIKRLLKSHYDFYATYLDISKDEAVKQAAKYIEPTDDYSQLVADEIKGTAEGAGVGVAEVMLIAAFNEVFYPKLGKNCTAFAVRGDATRDHLTYVGQNNDEGVNPWLDGDCTTLTRFVQTDAPNALIYTYAGAPAMMGINSSGLSVCINALVYKEARVGVPLLAVVREVMNQKTFDGAIAEIERANRPYSINFVLGTPSGIMDVESYPDMILTHSSDDMIWHTNHCLYQEGLRYENDEYRSNSVTRCDRIESLLRANDGKLDLQLLQSFLSDHENAPNSICWHVNPSKPVPKQSRTLDSMIYVPEKREAWIAKGNPCQTAFVKYIV